ncbi:hypothetical protein [Mycolicibacterium cosmeticum]|uniref:hypothetical protein n=1 Tax=Mycolicibacterium cosmeticum TaxID=258533 RepID=UPI00320471B0
MTADNDAFRDRRISENFMRLDDDTTVAVVVRSFPDRTEVAVTFNSRGSLHALELDASQAHTLAADLVRAANAIEVNR